MSYKYLYEKDNKDNSNIIRKLFNYLIKEGETNFNAGFHSAEIRLNRIEVEGLNNELER